MGEVLLPNKWVSDSMVFTKKNVAEVLAGKNIAERKPHFSTLEVYKETPVFILLTFGDHRKKLHISV